MPERIMDTKGLLKRECIVCGWVLGGHTEERLRDCLGRIDQMLKPQADVDASDGVVSEVQRPCTECQVNPAYAGGDICLACSLSVDDVGTDRNGPFTDREKLVYGWGREDGHACECCVQNGCDCLRGDA